MLGRRAGARSLLEWRFRVAPPGERRRPLVPDIAYVSFERMRGFTAEELEVPPFSPDVAVEVLSEGDRPRDVASKIGVFLRSGAALVILVDPENHTIALHDATGATTLRARGLMRHPALPGFALDRAALFARALDERPTE